MSVHATGGTARAIGFYNCLRFDFKYVRNMDRTQIINRAWRAYLSTDGAGAEQPIDRCSGERAVGGQHYVVLRNERRTLAVYRIRNGIGALRRMKRWPLALGREASSTHSTVRRPSSAASAHTSAGAAK